MTHRNILRQYISSLFDHQLMPTAFKVALFIGSLLFTINHGWALLTGHMTSERWISGSLTYFVPYMVSIHGQYIGRKR
ncbi:nitrate/nitrite transporter NrtS [Nostoc sp. PCC 9305]|uniref:nitrate/nitrite transporter NrtS n=1 Tax=Nostoc sp. PCC 9305 TaxID=296636 RepID=UPI0039C67755